MQRSYNPLIYFDNNHAFHQQEYTDGPDMLQALHSAASDLTMCLKRPDLSCALAHHCTAQQPPCIANKQEMQDNEIKCFVKQGKAQVAWSLPSEDASAETVLLSMRFMYCTAVPNFLATEDEA